MQESEQPQLDYAPAQPATGRIVRRWGVRIMLLAAIGFVVTSTPSVIRRVQLLTLQQKCLDYTAPADQIVFDTRTNSFPKLQRSDPDLISGNMGTVPCVGKVPSTWRSYRAFLPLSPPKALATVFTHRLLSPSGIERLVVVELYSMNSNPESPILVAWSITPGGLWKAPMGIVTGSISVFDASSEITFFSGRSDPKHQDHFTIHYQVGNQSKTIDGWLQTDQDELGHVVLEPRRDSDLTPSAPPSPASSH